MAAPAPPSSCPARRLLAEADQLLQTGNPHAAGYLYRALIDQPACTPICLQRLGVIALNTGDAPRAAELLQQALRLKPERWDAYPALCRALEQAGQPAALMATLNEWAAGRVRIHDRAGAERIYRKLLERDPLNYPAWANLGTCLAHLGRPKP
ncbi:MAG TPA: tetratricopeptide repeat protein, partial [Nevskiaceae bacterium]|nr:tetratricopeptide repeat protein [Nevskiaceae bacterium]